MFIVVLKHYITKPAPMKIPGKWKFQNIEFICLFLGYCSISDSLWEKLVNLENSKSILPCVFSANVVNAGTTLTSKRGFK